MLKQMKNIQLTCPKYLQSLNLAYDL